MLCYGICKQKNQTDVYRIAFDMRVVWYREKEETGKMQDVYANALV
jgi:hypothetical protein